jgi:hypothetical protein
MAMHRSKLHGRLDVEWQLKRKELFAKGLAHCRRLLQETQPLPDISKAFLEKEHILLLALRWLAVHLWACAVIPK